MIFALKWYGTDTFDLPILINKIDQFAENIDPDTVVQLSTAA